uniref:Uncharacterized protein n=1 Tax=viral metagenome TaxID=1070528 RepID=A0A6M3KKS2_9ZZZZ
MTVILTSGRKVVAAAGTAVTLESDRREVAVVIITAETGTVANTGYIVVGDSDVDETAATRTGHPLAAGDSLTLYGVDLSKVYIDAGVSGDGVTFLYWG